MFPFLTVPSPAATNMSDSQEVGVVLAFDLPVNLAKIGTGYLQDNPIAGFLISLLAFFVLMAVLAVPISALFGIEIFPGLLPHARWVFGGRGGVWVG